MADDDKTRGYFLNLIKHKNSKQMTNLIKTVIVRNQKNKKMQQTRRMRQMQQPQKTQQHQQTQSSESNLDDLDDLDVLKNVREMVKFEIKKSISNAKGSIIEEVKKEMTKMSEVQDAVVSNKLRNGVIESTIKNIEQELTGESIVIFILHPEQHLQNSDSDPDKLPNLVVVCDVGNDMPSPSSIESNIVIVPHEN
jgi:predicted secreted protein